MIRKIEFLEPRQRGSRLLLLLLSMQFGSMNFGTSLIYVHSRSTSNLRPRFFELENELSVAPYSLEHCTSENTFTYLFHSVFLLSSLLLLPLIPSPSSPPPSLPPLPHPPPLLDSDRSIDLFSLFFFEGSSEEIVFILRRSNRSEKRVSPLVYSSTKRYIT